MSKIGKKPIEIPKGVEIKIDGSLVSVKGPKGELKKTIVGKFDLKIDDDKFNIATQDTSGRTMALWGLNRALIQNMVKGVSDGFEKVLEFKGVGYKAAVKGKNLELSLGYSHPVTVDAPEGITFTTEKSSIKVSGIDKELVGEMAANIRSKRKPEPYKGSGIRYADEVIKKKAGKKAVTAA
jgi:large subunit ribosomal protein L6